MLYAKQKGAAKPRRYYEPFRFGSIKEAGNRCSAQGASAIGMDISRHFVEDLEAARKA